MLCNGLKRYSNISVWLLTAWCVSIKLIYCVFNYHINMLGENDSILFLSIIASSTFTLPFFLLVVCCLYFFFYKYSNYKISLLCLFMCIYFVNFNFNTNIVKQILNTQSLNLNLQNGLLNIHPICIYVTYGWVSIQTYLLLVKQYTYHTNILLNSTTNNVLYVILSGLILGAWWAAQELNWGGYWSWDPVELISLFLFIFVIKFIHVKKSIFKKSNIKTYFSAVIVIYFIMRLGVVATVHSFLKNSNTPYYVNLSVFIILLNIFGIIYEHKNFNTGIKNITYITKLFINWLLTLLILIFLNLILLNINIFEIMTINNLNNYYSLLSIFYFMYIIFRNKHLITLKNNNIIILKIFSIFLFCNVWVLLVVPYIIRVFAQKKFKLFHALLLLFYSIFFFFL